MVDTGYAPSRLSPHHNCTRDGQGRWRGTLRHDTHGTVIFRKGRLMSTTLAALFLLQAAAAPCTTVAPPPPELRGWAQPRAIDVGADAVLSPGVAVRAKLVPQSTLRFAVKPEKPGDAASHGGIFRFVTTQPGRYRVALSSGAWIDVVDGGRSVASVGHGHGPACSGIRKMVDFDLPAGTHIVQIAGSRADDLTMMVARLPR